MKVIVIGGGPAGMMAAISAANAGHEVTLLEKMNSLGKKLLITGKGRCNITSSLPMEKFIENVPGNGMFLYSSFNQFTNQDIINLLEKEGLKAKEERGHRIFPITDNAKDVLNVFIKLLKKANVEIKTNSKVNKILVNENKVVGVQYISDNKEENILADKVILATGGKSYPVTGSTGDGYEIAKQLGHSITKIKPSLIPLTATNKSLEICKQLQGLSLINVSIKLLDTLKNKVIYEDFGEMLFTHWGVSGPIILSSSAHLLRYKNVDELLKNQQIELKINLKPALSEEKLENRILRDFEEQKNKEFKNSLNNLLPKKLIEPIIELSGIDKDKKVNSITKQERMNLVKLLQNFTIKIKGFRPIEEAIITSGGISIKEINPKTMESKIISGLFFAGEIIDVDAYTGGFNLQIAYSTGYTAGTN
ncbi:MAG: NAD(P)/FAD-dependent oxidoreductase [Clostridia bacterium]